MVIICDYYHEHCAPRRLTLSCCNSRRDDDVQFRPKLCRIPPLPFHFGPYQNLPPYLWPPPRNSTRDSRPFWRIPRRSSAANGYRQTSRNYRICGCRRRTRSPSYIHPCERPCDSRLSCGPYDATFCRRSCSPRRISHRRRSTRTTSSPRQWKIYFHLLSRNDLE